MKEGNAYTNILSIMKEQGYNKDSTFVVGTVVGIDPLSIDMGDYVLDQEDLFIAEHLTEYDRKVTLKAEIVKGVTEEANLHSHTLLPFEITEGTMTFHQLLEIDDRVLVLIDGSDFYVIDRVVK